jgi:hypothetical protein
MGLGKGTKPAHEDAVLGQHAANAYSVPATLLFKRKN